jgi:hypothetical protein
LKLSTTIAIMLEGALKRIDWLTSALVPFLIVYVDFQIMNASIVSI